jgi:N-acetylmuramic acid 6-phosphate etherase
MSETETVSPRYAGLDTWSDAQILEAFWEGQARAVAAVRPALPAIAAAATAMAARLAIGRGRLIYVGAGTSGRQAALDGMELRATFGWPNERVAIVLAEGPLLDPGRRMSDEDDTRNAERQMQALGLSSADALIAVAASGTTPFTLAAAEAAKKAGALIVGIANNRQAPLLRLADHPILLETGAEVIAGSTRMNAGTAQKAALGFLSSVVMTRLGHVHDGLMVSMRTDCAKLRRRGARIVAEIAGSSEAEAATALQAHGGRIKPAVLALSGAEPAEAEGLLAEAHGNLRLALDLLRARAMGEAAQ